MCYDSLGSYKNGYAIVAQLDRAFGSDPEGQRFESSRSHQKGCCTRVIPRAAAFSFYWVPARFWPLSDLGDLHAELTAQRSAFCRSAKIQGFLLRAFSRIPPVKIKCNSTAVPSPKRFGTAVLLFYWFCSKGLSPASDRRPSPSPACARSRRTQCSAQQAAQSRSAQGPASQSR